MPDESQEGFDSETIFGRLANAWLLAWGLESPVSADQQFSFWGFLSVKGPFFGWLGPRARFLAS